MPRTLVCDDSLELTGSAAASLISSINRDNFLPILRKNGLDEIDTEQWYSMPKILDVLAQISSSGTGTEMMDLVSIGMAAGARSVLPDQVLALEPQKFLDVYASVFPTRHRGGDPGSIRIEHLDTAHTHIISTTVYPDDLFYGLMYGLLRRVVKQGHFVLKYVAQMDEGDPETVIEVNWKK